MPRRASGLRRWLLRLALLAGVAVVAWGAWEAWHWPDVGALARRNPSSTAFIDRYRAQARAAGRDGRVAWTWVPYGTISSHLKRAVLVAEDIRFFSHNGFEPTEWRHAVERAIEHQEMPRGASTITQQLAKNLWLSPSRNPLRKAKEAVLTWQLERTLPKRRILELYLNVAEFGPGVYGAEAASRRYFGVSAAELGENQAAQMAASLPMPSRWHPGAPGPAYKRYVETIRRRMAKAELRVSN
ncbi:MAG: monofunctional biosynthetic peptidoglycan transglycosylase [Candidatus Rokubacteria bacterium]|nr:monofunctional biosynthetic peptidoglycan transglycosylase [Candidatus Rokubacteria bacterium]